MIFSEPYRAAFKHGIHVPEGRMNKSGCHLSKTDKLVRKILKNIVQVLNYYGYIA